MYQCSIACLLIIRPPFVGYSSVDFFILRIRVPSLCCVVMVYKHLKGVTIPVPEIPTFTRDFYLLFV